MSYIVCSQPGHHGNVSLHRPEGCHLLIETTESLLSVWDREGEREHFRISRAVSRLESPGLFPHVPLEEHVLEFENVFGSP